MSLSKAQETVILRNLGWRIRNTTDFTRAVRNFQAGWNLGPALVVDGKPGPKTDAALLISEKRRRENKGTASANFSFLEVQCRCGGKYSSCWRIWFKRSAFQMLERYRAKSGKPLTVVSGCRCPSHNKAVGGSPTSRHPQGLAADVPPRYTVKEVTSWQVATHIGYSPSMQKVVHIDLGTGGSKIKPITYPDGR
jgi:zinc D-Ala-D-Ala carboxypeptidase